jgi:hypothetical protein
MRDKMSLRDARSERWGRVLWNVAIDPYCDFDRVQPWKTEWDGPLRQEIQRQTIPGDGLQPRCQYARAMINIYSRGSDPSG